MVWLWLIASLVVRLVVGIPSPESLQSDVTILVDNDLQGPGGSAAGSGILFLGTRLNREDGSAACKALGESLWDPELKLSSIKPNLDFLVYDGRVAKDEKFWVGGADGSPQILSAKGVISTGESADTLPVLCTHTAPFSNVASQDTSERWRVSVHSNNEDVIGFRDRNSFRFFGIRYAPQPQRFSYAELYRGTGRNASALEYPSQCIQRGSGSEDCLFLNIWSPYLPRPNIPSKQLKPVMFWIHGGGYTGGSSSDTTFDGGNMVSRGDVVLVALNYRLGNLGFLALDDGKTRGNYGLADTILGLEWVKEHIKDFGGDPDNITIFGQSAGAGTVRAMMASPKAKGLFKQAILMSNLGGYGYGKPYSKYYSIEEEMEVVGQAVLDESGCEDVRCLREMTASEISTLSSTGRYLVVDGEYLTSDHLEIDGEALGINLMMGIAAEDGSPFLTYRPGNATDAKTLLASQGLPYPSKIVFPEYEFDNETLAQDWIGARLATDAVFRCIDQATAHGLLQTGRLPRIYYYEFDRTYQTPGWPKSSLCEPEGRPDGNPDAGPYMRCHSGELLYVFGNILREGLPLRDEIDIQFERMVLDLFASFARSGNPNADQGYLSARGFDGTSKLLAMAGAWEPAVKGGEKLMALDWPETDGKAGGGMMEGFRDVEQCEVLDVGLEYYLREASR